MTGWLGLVSSAEYPKWQLVPGIVNEKSVWYIPQAWKPYSDELCVFDGIIGLEPLLTVVVPVFDFTLFIQDAGLTPSPNSLVD